MGTHMAMGCERLSRFRRLPFRWILAATCLLTGACQAPPPPFSEPQPQPDWSDPERQGKATVEALSCDRIRATREHGCWSLHINARIVANSRETAELVARAICFTFCSTAPHAARLREVEGATIQLSEPYRPWITFSDPMLCTDPVHPEYPAKQLPSGEWAIETPTSFITKGLPSGEVELTIDGEALRKALSNKRGWMLDCVPVGGLTGTTSVFTVPTPKPSAIVWPNRP